MTAYRDRLHAGHYEDRAKAVKVTSTKYEPETKVIDAIDAAADGEGLKPIETAPLMQRTPKAKRTPKANPSK